MIDDDDDGQDFDRHHQGHHPLRSFRSSQDGPVSMDEDEEDGAEEEEEVVQGMLLNVLLAKTPGVAPAA